MTKEVYYEIRGPRFVTFEKGRTADWRYLRRQTLTIAARENVNAGLYTHNEYFNRWDFLGHTTPEGMWYDFGGHGPYVLDEDGNGFSKVSTKEQ